MLVATEGQCVGPDGPVKSARSEVPRHYSRVYDLSAGAAHVEKNEHQHDKAEKADAPTEHLPSPLHGILLAALHARADECKLT
jgi:hypothetical protein